MKRDIHIHSGIRLALSLGIMAWMGPLPSALAVDLQLNVIDKKPPSVFAAPIRDVLSSQCVQLVNGAKPLYEFWFRQEMPLKGKPAMVEEGLRAVTQSALMGVAVVHKSRRDYRDDELYADTYTMRFSLQPQDGNHLGTSEYPYFLALVAAKLDTSLDGLSTYKQLVKASSQDTATDHPIIISLRPPQDGRGDFPRLHVPAPDHKSILLKIPAKADQDKVDLIFNLVYEGVSVH